MKFKQPAENQAQQQRPPTIRENFHRFHILKIQGEYRISRNPNPNPNPNPNEKTLIQNIIWVRSSLSVPRGRRREEAAQKGPATAGPTADRSRKIGKSPPT